MTFDIRTINIAIEIFGILICTTILLCRSFLIGSRQRELRTVFTALVFCEIPVLFTSALCGILTGTASLPLQRLLGGAYFFRYFFVYLLLGLFTEYVICFFRFPKASVIRFIAWGLIALSTAALILNCFFPFYFFIDRSGVCRNTEFFRFSQLPCVLICLEDLVCVFLRKKEISGGTFRSFLLYILLPVAALTVQLFFFRMDVINIALVIVMMYMFAVMQKRFADEYVEQKKLLRESQTRLMMSQIKPHFLFNSLTSIAQLCDDDPKLAKETTIAFSSYLRGNLASLEKTGPIPFSEELNHIRNYLQIESVRFGELLNVVYDVETEDFRVPALSIQPLVENAVKHGVGMKEDGGTVTLSVRRRGGSIVITVADDGVGFDPAEKIGGGEKSIGIRNSLSLLKNECGAEAEIDSAPGAGTTVTVVLPGNGGKPE